MGQIIEALPKEGKVRIKTTYENIFDDGVEEGFEKGIEKGIEKGLEKGLEKGIPIGKKRGEALKQLQLAFDAIQIGMETPFIVQFFKISENLVKLIKRNIDKDFKAEALKIILVNELLSTSEYLGTDDIAEFCRVPLEMVEKMKTDLFDEVD